MTNENDKPERAATRSRNVPSLVRGLLVITALPVLVGGTWLFSQWYLKESERETALDDIQAGLPADKLDSEFRKNLDHVGSIRIRLETGRAKIDPHKDIILGIGLRRADYDWYVFIYHYRRVKLNRASSSVIAGVDVFRIQPPSPDYRYVRPSSDLKPRSLKMSTAQWRYVMDFAYQFYLNQSTSEFEAKWIHSSWREGCKPDPRFDFGEMVE